ncbi:MAG: Mut7-C RNAse domain-containing protein [Acidobacteriota bacterium]
MASTEYRFFADAMLGTLARWLRILGYDTEYQRDVDDDDLVRRCVAEGRIALTKDRRLVERRALHNALLIRSKRLGPGIRTTMKMPPLMRIMSNLTRRHSHGTSC